MGDNGEVDLYGDDGGVLLDEDGNVQICGDCCIETEPCVDCGGGIISSFQDVDGPNVQANIVAGHGLANGDYIVIGGTGGVNYDGFYTIENVQATSFEFPHAWLGNMTGCWGIGQPQATVTVSGECTPIFDCEAAGIYSFEGFNPSANYCHWRWGDGSWGDLHIWYAFNPDPPQFPDVGWYGALWNPMIIAYQNADKRITDLSCDVDRFLSGSFSMEGYHALCVGCTAHVTLQVP